MSTCAGEADLTAELPRPLPVYHSESPAPNGIQAPVSANGNHVDEDEDDLYGTSTMDAVGPEAAASPIDPAGLAPPISKLSAYGNGSHHKAYKLSLHAGQPGTKAASTASDAVAQPEVQG